MNTVPHAMKKMLWQIFCVYLHENMEKKIKKKKKDCLDNLTLSKSILINVSVKYMLCSSVKHNQVIVNSTIHILED